MRFVSVLYHDVFPDAGYDYGRICESATRYHVAAGAFSAAATGSLGGDTIFSFRAGGVTTTSATGATTSS